LIAEHLLARVEDDIQAELIMAKTSQSDRPAVLADAELPFDAAAVQAYEIRLSGLRDAVGGMQAYENPKHDLDP
jgi:hypothetical protein